ncbi:MAG: 30S ribosomal protein S3ae [Candidatus Bathyarchaeia archaeon]
MSSKGRRVRDKWRAKAWFSVYSPPYFGEVELGDIPANEGKGLLGRSVQTSLYDVTKDPSHMNIVITFQITDVDGNKAKTIFKGHEYARDYLRTLIRRGSKRVDGIFNVKTKDGYGLRLSVLACTLRRINSAQGSAIRRIMGKILEERSQVLNFEQLVQEAVLGKLASDIYNEAKKIAPLRHVGISKSKLLFTPALEAKVEDVQKEQGPLKANP